MEKGGARPREPVHPLIEKVLTSKVPIAELIGFGGEEIGDGRAALSSHAGPQHANPMGTLHGGVLCDLADTAMGLAFVTTLAADESFTTVALSIISSAQSGRHACVPRRGSSTGEGTSATWNAT